MDEIVPRTRPTSLNTGNPRVTVAFPFSKIEIRGSEPALADLATLLQRLAEHVATLSRAVGDDAGDAADELVEAAAELAARLN